MNSLCQKCDSKPALTICLKGRLCFVCGNKCHGEYQHPVEFIRHCDEASRPDRKTMKSSTIITTSKSLKVLPKRVSKVSSKICLTKAKIEPSQSRFKKTTTEGSMFYQSNKENRKELMNINKSKLKESKKSIGIMAEDNAVPQKEIQILRKKLAKQDEVIKLLCDKLKKEKNDKQAIRKNYEQKLKFIRNLRD